MIEVSRIMTVAYINRRDWCLISFLTLDRGLCAEYQSRLLDNWRLNQAVLKCYITGWILNYDGIECNVKHVSSINTIYSRGRRDIDLGIQKLMCYKLYFFLPSNRFRTLNAVWSTERFVQGPVVLLVLWHTVAHGPALRTQNRHGAFTHRTPVTRNHAARPEMSAKWTLKTCKINLAASYN
jgi:hypothetical protein